MKILDIEEIKAAVPRRPLKILGIDAPATHRPIDPPEYVTGESVGILLDLEDADAEELKGYRVLAIRKTSAAVKDSP